MLLRLLGTVACLCSFVSALADIGQIKNMAGEVTIVRGEQSIAANPGDWLEGMDTIITGPEARVGITFVDNSRFSAGPNTTVELSRFSFDKTTHEGEFLTSLKSGTLSVVSGQIAKRSPDQMKVKTPSSLLAVRGTTFLVKVDN